MEKIMKTMNDLFLHLLKDIYYAEKQILKALPKMVKAAETSELKRALEKHQHETEGQVQRLEQVFSEIDKPARDGTLIAWAEQLGMADSVSALKQTLEEEKAADKKLTEIAEASVNRKAA